MSSNTAPTYDDLYAWAARHSPWQLETLKRVVENGSLEESDIAELAALACNPPSDASPSASSAPVGKASAAADGLPVSLCRIREITHVNALAPGPVVFQQSGITILFGKNASGKSGVTRILKKACRAADPGGDVLPSYHDADPDEPASAVLDFEVDGKPDDFRWVDGGKENTHLRDIHVFDQPSALALVNQPKRLDYTPEMVQALQRLEDGTKRVADKLEADKRVLGDRPEMLVDPLRGSESAIAKRFQTISTATSEAEIAAITEFSEDDALRLQLLESALQDDPIQGARALDERLDLLEAHNETLVKAAGVFSDQALSALRSEEESASAAVDALALAREVFSERSALPEVGGEAWRALWNAARAYSEQAAYPDHPFPHVDDALCVLCQQPIDQEAAERLSGFEAFVTSDVQRRADQAGRTVSELRSPIRATAVPRSWVVAELAGFERGSSEWTTVKRFVVAAKLRRRRALEGRSDLPALPALPDLQGTINRIRERAEALRMAARDDERLAMASERAELTDRKALSPLKDAISREVERLKDVEALDRVIKTCDAGRITRKSGEVARALIDGVLGAAFARNLASLGFDTTGIGISMGRGSRAVHPWTMRLMEDPKISPDVVLSEGERTCVALAGFLAELEAGRNRSAIVLDDPVSSLDHIYRDKVAQRLVEEAKNRQVIVLTHEIVFLYDLRTKASKAGLRTRELSLERGHRRHGVMKEGAPWDALTVSKRVSSLRSELRTARRALEDEDRDGYELHCERIYTRLRQTWERAVEEGLLRGVVQRFHTDVKTRELRYLVDISDDDVRTVDHEMSYCSDHIHDSAGPRTVDIPEPAVVESDIARVAAWLESLAARRKKI